MECASCHSLYTMSATRKSEDVRSMREKEGTCRRRRSECNDMTHCAPSALLARDEPKPDNRCSQASAGSSPSPCHDFRTQADSQIEARVSQAPSRPGAFVGGVIMIFGNRMTASPTRRHVHPEGCMGWQKNTHNDIPQQKRIAKEVKTSR